MKLLIPALLLLFLISCDSQKPQQDIQVSAHIPVVENQEGKSDKAEQKTDITKKEAKRLKKQAKAQKDTRITAEDVRKETREAVALAKKFTEQAEREYHQKIDEKLAAFNRELEELRANAENLSTKAKNQVSMEIKALGSKMELTTNQFQDLNKSNEERLTELNKTFEEMLASIEKGAASQPSEEKQAS